jgi:hypothetical protein
VNDEAKVIIMNGKTDVESDEYSKGCNFVVGGNTLGRGSNLPESSDDILHPYCKESSS